MHLGAERLQHARGGISRPGEEVIDDAGGEHRDLRDGIARVRLGDLTRAVVEGIVRDGGEAFLLRERPERQPDVAVAPERILEGREPAGDPVDPLGRRPLAEEHALGPRHPRSLRGLRAHVGDERGERDAHRADRVAGVASHAQCLLVRDAVDPVMPGGDDEPDGSGVDVTEDVAADLEVARTHVAAGSAADAAKGVAEERVLAHGHAAVVDEHEVQLLRSVHADLALELDVGGS